MNKRAIVNIVSEQTIPNVLYIKEFSKTPISEYIFITTPRMEKEGVLKRIINVCSIDAEKIKRIQVSYDDFLEITQKLSDGILEPQKEYFVNLTGGTKIMAIAVYKSFSELHTRFFYLPINKNYFEEILTGEKFNISYSITIEEYMRAYGYYMEKTQVDLMPFEDLQKLLNAFLLNLNSEGKFKLSAKLKERFRDGTWFEEYIYQVLKQVLKKYKHDMNIRINVYGNNMRSEHTHNEIDIALTYNNDLYIFECKTTTTSNLSEELYKLSAVIKNMGLKAKGILVTLNPHAVQSIHAGGYIRNQSFLDRAKLLNLEIITLAELQDEDILKKRFKEILGLEEH